MNPATLKALRQSARKWQNIYENRGTDKGRDNCALCKRFGPSCGLPDEACPIFAHTGRMYCCRTPLTLFCEHATETDAGYKAETPEAKAAALAMYELLCKLTIKQ